LGALIRPAVAALLFLSSIPPCLHFVSHALGLLLDSGAPQVACGVSFALWRCISTPCQLNSPKAELSGYVSFFFKFNSQLVDGVILIKLWRWGRGLGAQTPWGPS
jgi:hypothetical protein